MVIVLYSVINTSDAICAISACVTGNNSDPNLDSNPNLSPNPNSNPKSKRDPNADPNPNLCIAGTTNPICLNVFAFNGTDSLAYDYDSTAICIWGNAFTLWFFIMTIMLWMLVYFTCKAFGKLPIYFPDIPGLE